MLRWINPPEWQQTNEERIAAESRMLDERRRIERDKRECMPSEGPLTPPFMADGLLVAPCAMRKDKSGQFVVVSVDGRLCCLGEERSTNKLVGAVTTRTVLMLVESDEHEDAPACPTAVDWCEFEFHVRTRDGDALAAYGLMLAALVIRAVDEEQRMRDALGRADAVFADVDRAMDGGR